VPGVLRAVEANVEQAVKCACGREHTLTYRERVKCACGAWIHYNRPEAISVVLPPTKRGTVRAEVHRL
jgi:hypothetical protein